MRAAEERIPVRDVSEAALLARARTGDDAAIRLLVQQNNRRLYRVARAVLGEDAEAEDVVQETYLRAFRSLESFRGGAAFSTWLTRIALNEALQRLRRRRRWPLIPWQRTFSDAPRTDVIAFPGTPESPDPERDAARRQLREVIEAAVERLPTALRIVFVLRDIEEMSVEETASQLGLKAATVKTRLHRARKRLRGHLDAEIATTLNGTFPFAGARCARMADRVMDRLRP